jgi:hypothetical protein
MAARMVVHRSLHGEPMLSARPPSDLDKLVFAPISRLGLFDPPSAEQQRRCALVVAGRARDADDARLLLDVLGLKGDVRG